VCIIETQKDNTAHGIQIRKWNFSRASGDEQCSPEKQPANTGSTGGQQPAGARPPASMGAKQPAASIHPCCFAPRGGSFYSTCIPGNTVLLLALLAPLLLFPALHARQEVDSIRSDPIRSDPIRLIVICSFCCCRAVIFSRSPFPSPTLLCLYKPASCETSAVSRRQY